LIIDTGAGVGPNVLSFCAAADHVLVVTTPDPTAITDAYALVKTLARERPDVEVRVLVNMVENEREARAIFDRIATVCARFLDLRIVFAGWMVACPSVTAAVRSRKPFITEKRQSPAAECVRQFAHRLDRHAAERGSGNGLIRRMARRLWA